MKLEDIFFKKFFYPFLIGIFLSTLVITIFLAAFTNNNYCIRTRNNVINLEKKYSKLNINSVNTLITMSFQKIQASLNEQIILYQKISNELITSKKSPILNNTFLKSYISMDENYCINNEKESSYTAYWLLDNETAEEDLDNESKKEVKLQLITYSNMISNIDSGLQATQPNAISFYFYFDKTELYISYPIISDCKDNYFYEMKNLTYGDDDIVTCINDEGVYYNVYKLKCEPFFMTMLKSKTNAFDNNYLLNQNKTIFITNYYSDADDLSEREYSICIEFIDPITKDKAYVCADVYNEDMVASLENLNSNIIGYFFITNIGFNNVFYFPQGTISPKTSTENIYKWSNEFSLSEKVYFYNNIRKIFSSNYIEYLSDYSINNEIFVNGKNSSEQYFLKNGKKIRYSIYPIILENLNGQKEHIFSIIYVYKEDLFLEEINSYSSSIAAKILLELGIFIIFGSGLLYIIFLTFNTLAKYIVIPIKNVNYMLKGINIGGEDRLNYLDFLKKKQDDNLEKLEKMYLYELNNENNENNENDLIEQTGNDLDNEYEYGNDKKENTNLINKMSPKDSKGSINPDKDFNEKYDEESNYIKKESSFYDFDEQLLQYRPLEIERLTESLINLKSALNFTSEDRQVEKIIDYSKSEDIFRTFKNKEGAFICQSNIGNLQSQLLKYDKAIYHLALSLQDNQLKKFLNRNLNDELDESDSLINKILYSFNKEKNKTKNNILSIKQMNNSKENFSQKIIGILINTRYCRLIQVYYMFFKNLKKLKKSNNDLINGLFMNTQFHTIKYYHKIIIQFIFLSYIKNDLVKIGESILDYIEFLIKFKFKTSSDNKYFLKIKNKEISEYKIKKKYKKNIFNKIIKWFDLFDNYISYVKDNSTIGQDKSIVDYLSSMLNSENNEFNLESQSTVMFRVNIQRGYFLKAKFCLCSTNYKDALFYFIRAAKRKTIIIDGLIKKRSLKHIYKLLLKMKKNYEIFKLNHLNFEQEINSLQNNKNKKYLFKPEKVQSTDLITFEKIIEGIKMEISKDIEECNAKQEKDIIILIDFNKYNNNPNEDLNTIKYKVDRFIDQTIIILNNYLSLNDRFGVFIYTKDYHIICPLINVNEIDTNSFSKDLMQYKSTFFNEGNESEEYDLDLNIKFNLGPNNNISEHSEEDSFDLNDKEGNDNNKIIGFVNAINYINSYSKMKESSTNEKYIIIFTDIFNVRINDDKKIEKIFGKLKGDERSILLLVGKNKNLNLKKEKYNNFENKKFEKLIVDKFGEKSEIIYFENMKKIKTILYSNKVIKDEIIYPNEIYK